MTAVTLNEQRQAARRLLISWDRLTVADFQELQYCHGCEARDDRGARVVSVVAGCPSHDRNAA
jgi:hypothetical protein